MARMLEGKQWERNDLWGPDVYAVVFRDPGSGERTVVAWTTRPYAFLRLNNEQGLTFYDVYGTERRIPKDPKGAAPVISPLCESPIYIAGPGELRCEEAPNPGIQT